MAAFALGVALLPFLSPAFGQVAVDPLQLQRVRQGGESLRERLRPFQLDRRQVDRLFRHVLEYGSAEDVPGCGDCALYVLRKAAVEENGSLSSLTLEALEIPTDPGAGADPETGVKDLVLRQTFAPRMVVTRQRRPSGLEGRGVLDVWVYTVGLDGRLIQVEHRLDGREYKMSPRDPWVLNRWRTLFRELLLILPVVDA